MSQALLAANFLDGSHANLQQIQPGGVQRSRFELFSMVAVMIVVFPVWEIVRNGVLQTRIARLEHPLATQNAAGNTPSMLNVDAQRTQLPYQQKNVKDSMWVMYADLQHVKDISNDTSQRVSNIERIMSLTTTTTTTATPMTMKIIILLLLLLLVVASASVFPVVVVVVVAVVAVVVLVVMMSMTTTMTTMTTTTTTTMTTNPYLASCWRVTNRETTGKSFCLVSLQFFSDRDCNGEKLNKLGKAFSSGSWVSRSPDMALQDPSRDQNPGKYVPWCSSFGGPPNSKYIGLTFDNPVTVRCVRLHGGHKHTAPDWYSNTVAVQSCVPPSYNTGPSVVKTSFGDANVPDNDVWHTIRL